MGGLSAAAGAFLALAWCINLAIPAGWHTVRNTGLVNYDVGLYSYKVSKGTTSQALSVGVGLAERAGMVDKDKKSGEKLNGLIGEGSYSLHEVEQDQCVQFVEVVGAVYNGALQKCNMWRSLLVSSYILFGCIVVGSMLALVAAYLNYNTSNQSKNARTARNVTGILAPATGLIGLLIYFTMTLNFPDPSGGGKLSFGVAFWVAATTGILLAVVNVVAIWTSGAEKRDAYSEGSSTGQHLRQENYEHNIHGGPQAYQTFGQQFNPMVGSPMGQSSWQEYRSPSPQPPADDGSCLVTSTSPAPVWQQSPSSNPGSTMHSDAPPPPASWGLVAPPAPNIFANTAAQNTSTLPGLAKSHPFDR